MKEREAAIRGPDEAARTRSGRSSRRPRRRSQRVKAVLKERKADKGMEKIAQLAASQGGTDSLLELYSKTQKEMVALQEKLSVMSSSETAGFEAQAEGLRQQIRAAGQGARGGEG